MNKINYITIGALVSIVIVLGICYLVPTPVVNVNPVIEIPMGAVSGPELSFPSWTVNGVRWHYLSMSMLKATTTTWGSQTNIICSMLTPAATTTLISGTINFTTSSTSASVIAFTESATAYATTTVLGATYIIPANGQAAIVASTTASLSGGKNIIKPSQYITVGMSGGTGTFTPVGTCHAVLAEL